MNKDILAPAILFILLFQIMRAEDVTNQVVIILIAILFIFFVALSIPSFLNFGNKNKIRLISLLLIAFILYGFLLSKTLTDRINQPNLVKVYDGAILTEIAFKAILSGQNPYTISYGDFFGEGKYWWGYLPAHASGHYTYSPLTFLVNIPVFLATSNLFTFIDARITSIIFFFLAAWIGSMIVSKKLLFLTIFLFNPVFINKLFFGSNDIFPLFFLFSCLAFLYLNKVSLSIITLGLATGTKLTAIPMVPVYFLYLFLKSEKKNERIRIVLRQILLFIFINLLVYLPFLIISPKDLIDDILLYHISGGDSGRPIAGFLGVPQLLNSFGIIPQQSSFPFFLLVLPAALIMLFVIYRLFQKTLQLSVLVLSYFFLFVVFFSFSRILQTDYLAFLSQILLLAAFVVTKGARRKV